MLKWIFIYSALFALTFSAKSQTLRLLIKDENTDKPLEKASLLHNDTLLKTTDVLGMLELNVKSFRTKSFEISMVGYVPYKLELTDSIIQSQTKLLGYIFIMVPMKQEPSYINQVVITANKGGSKLAEATVSIESIKPYLLQNKNPSDLSNLVDQIPGVSITDQQVNIRSGSGWSYGTGTRVLVLMDGLPMISGDAGQVQWSFIPIESVANIEVLKGAASVLYGSSALNGIINIRTDKAIKKPITRISMYSGFYDKPERNSLDWSKKTLFTHGIGAFHSFVKNKTTYTFNGQAFSDDGYRMEEFTKRARFGASFLHKSNIKGLEYGISSQIQQSKSGTFLLWESYTLGYTALDSGYSHSNSRRLSVDPTVTFKNRLYKHSLSGRYFSVENKVTTSDQSSNQSNGSGLIYGEYRIEKTIPKWRSNWLAGATIMHSETHSPLFSGNQSNGNRAIFGQFEIKTGKLISNFGARIEHYKLNDFTETKPVFRCGFNYKLKNFTYLRASAGQGYRFPSVAETFIKTSVGPVKVYPNTGLQSETGWNLEAGIKQGLKLGNFIGYIDFSAFVMEFNNMMEFTFSQWSSDNTLQNLLGLGFKSVNIGHTRNSGYEIGLGGEGKLGPGTLKLLTGYNYNNPISLEPDRVFATDSLNTKLTFNNTSSDKTKTLKYRNKKLFRFDAQYTYKKAEAGISWRYNSNIDNIDAAFVNFPISFFVPGIADARTKNKKGVWICDTRFGFKASEKIKVSLIISNVFNKEYMTRPADLRPPRSFQLQVFISF